MPETYAYVGEELDLFSHARNWKAYIRRHLRRHMRGDVLEVGAGIGSTTRILLDPSYTSWTCLEPDPQLAARLTAAVEDPALNPRPSVTVGTLASFGPDDLFDTILYVDVLEHIEHDRQEVALAAEHLKAGGKLIILAPAHQSLYSPFDKSIGHFRRYTRKSLAALTPPTIRVVENRYLDCVGLLASTANRLLLKQSMPTRKQIGFWDGVLVPMSRVLDKIVFNSMGKTVVCVWER